MTTTVQQPKLELRLSTIDTVKAFNLTATNLQIQLINSSDSDVDIPDGAIGFLNLIELHLIGSNGSIVRTYGTSKKLPENYVKLNSNESRKYMVSPFDDGPTESPLPIGEYTVVVKLLNPKDHSNHLDFLKTYHGLKSNQVKISVIAN